MSADSGVEDRVLEKGGFAEITDDDWRKVVLSLGFESCSEEIVRVMKGNYEVELFPFEKWWVLRCFVMFRLLRRLVPTAGKKAMTEQIEMELLQEKDGS